MSDHQWDFAGTDLILGVDEVGVGPLAGPMTAAAVILRPGAEIDGLRDSKKLSAAARTALAPKIARAALVWVVEWIEVSEINALGPKVRFSLMAECVNKALSKGRHQGAVLVVVDGNTQLPISCPQVALVGGDDRCREVAAASVLAKVHRDEYMAELAQKYPQYGWERNAGYGTEEHVKAIVEHGVTPYHRRRYAENAVRNFKNKHG